MLTKHEYAQLDYYFRVRNAAGFILGQPPVVQPMEQMRLSPIAPRYRYRKEDANADRKCGLCHEKGHDRRSCPARRGGRP